MWHEWVRGDVQEGFWCADVRERGREGGRETACKTQT
jgi:hypothetical protein